MLNDRLLPEWQVDARIGALMTTRDGGVSAPPFDSLNLGRSAGDEGAAVDENRRRFAAALGAPTRYLSQVHSSRVVRLTHADRGSHEADAAITTEPGLACTVMVADCLPVLFAAPRGVGAAHAGWRGLAAGVLEATVQALCDAAGCAPVALSAWLGPCIGPAAVRSRSRCARRLRPGGGRSLRCAAARGRVAALAGRPAGAGARSFAGIGCGPDQRRHLVHRSKTGHGSFRSGATRHRPHGRCRLAPCLMPSAWRALRRAGVARM